MNTAILPGYALRRACAVVIVSTLLSSSVWATVALSFSGGGNGSGGVATWGWAFTLSSAVSVTDLGFADFGLDGLNESHKVTIWTDTGTSMAVGTVPSGSGAPLISAFRYQPITPVILPAGSYVIDAYYPSSADLFHVFATPTTAAEVTYGGSRQINGDAFTPANPQGFANGYFGPNFQYTAAPEPTAAALLLGGGLLPGVRRWRRFAAVR